MSAPSPAVALLKPHNITLPVAPAVTADETVTFHHHDANHPGWFHGTDPRGITGYFPAAWFHFNADNSRATAQRDYNAAELTVAPGDLVYVLATVTTWHLVITADTQRQGWIPRDCLPAPAAVTA